MRSWLTIALLVLVLVGAATLAFRIEASFTKDEYVRPELPVIQVNSVYEEGLWTITGSVQVPTACSEVAAAVQADAEGVIRVDVTTPEDTGICLMLPTEKKYKVEVEAGEDAVVHLYLNGVKAIIE